MNNDWQEKLFVDEAEDWLGKIEEQAWYKVPYSSNVYNALKQYRTDVENYVAENFVTKQECEKRVLEAFEICRQLNDEWNEDGSKKFIDERIYKHIEELSDDKTE